MAKILRALFSPEVSCAAAALVFGAAWMKPEFIGTEAFPGLIFFYFFELLLFLHEAGFAMAASSRSREVFGSVRHAVFYVYGIAALVLNATLGSLWPLVLFLARALPLWLAPGINFETLTDEDEEWFDLRAVRYGVLPLLLWGESFFLGHIMSGGSGGITREIAAQTSDRMSEIVKWFKPETIAPLIIAGAVYYSLLLLGHLFFLGDEGLFMTYLRRSGRLKHIK